MTDLGYSEVKEVFAIIDKRIKNNDELTKVLTLIKSLTMKHDLIKKRVRAETIKETYQKIVDKLYSEFINMKGRQIATIMIKRCKNYSIDLLFPKEKELLKSNE